MAKRLVVPSALVLLFASASDAMADRHKIDAFAARRFVDRSDLDGQGYGFGYSLCEERSGALCLRSSPYTFFVSWTKASGRHQGADLEQQAFLGGVQFTLYGNKKREENKEPWVEPFAQVLAGTLKQRPSGGDAGWSFLGGVGFGVEFPIPLAEDFSFALRPQLQLFWLAEDGGEFFPQTSIALVLRIH